MATRSRIGIEINGRIHSIYCHWDGYPENNGKILLNHYSDPEKVMELIELGDISSLAPNLKPELGVDHSFNNPQDGVVVAYGRDRGKETRRKSDHSLASFIMGDVEEYGYVMVAGEWLFINGHKNSATRTAIPLIEVIS